MKTGRNLREILKGNQSNVRRWMLHGFSVTASIALLMTGCANKDTAFANTEGLPVQEQPVLKEEDGEGTRWSGSPIVHTHDIPDTENLKPPFSEMSMDWDEWTLNGWYHYEIPERSRENGGYLPDIVQVYTYALCKRNGIEYSVLLAMIEVESNYHWDAVGDDGDLGYLQIVPKWNLNHFEEDAAKEMLLNPYGNISVGIHIFSKLSARYETIEEALTAYCYGSTGAYRRFWSKGKVGSPYSDKVLETAKRIRKELAERREEAMTLE